MNPGQDSDFNTEGGGTRPGRPWTPERFTSAMTRGERIAVLLYFPLHLWLLPMVLLRLPLRRNSLQAH